MKREVEEFQESISMYEFSGSIDDIRKTLDRIEREYEGRKVFIRDNSYGDNPDFSLVESRLETDEEYNKRLTKEEEDKERRRKMYLKLQEEFGTE